MVIKERFKIQSYDWQNFSVLRKRLRKIGGRICRFDCTLFLPSAHYEKKTFLDIYNKTIAGGFLQRGKFICHHLTIVKSTNCKK